MQRWIIRLLLALIFASLGTDRRVQGAAETAQPLYSTTDGNLLLPLQGEQQPQIVLSHATDCLVNITNARIGNLCRDLDDGRVWRCTTPALGGNATFCDSAGEWVQVQRAPLNEVSLTIPQLAAADDDMPLMEANRAIRVVRVACRYKGTTPTLGPTFALKKSNGTTGFTSMTHTAPTCVGPGAALSWQTVTNNAAASVAAGLQVAFDVTNSPNPDATQTYTLTMEFEVPE